MGDLANFLDDNTPISWVSEEDPFTRFTSLGWGHEDNVLTDTVKSIGDVFQGPEIPEPPKPEAQTMAGDEGIRRGEIKRQSKKRELKSLYLTRGQSRAPTLGEMKQTLG